MKLIFENSEDLLAEAILDENKRKSYKIRGVFSTMNEKNKNGRIYPNKIWEDNIEQYQRNIIDGNSNTLMELNHPPRSSVEMMEAVAKINKLWIDGKYVMGEAILLDNPKANQLKTLIDNGIKMSVSSRGVGNVGKGGIVESFKLITYDIIPDQGQSDYNAQMNGIVEGVLMSEEFKITESGNVICDENGCSINEEKVDCECELKKIYKPEVLKEASKEIFKSMFKNMKTKSLDESIEEFNRINSMTEIEKLIEEYKSTESILEFDMVSSRIIRQLQVDKVKIDLRDIRENTKSSEELSKLDESITYMKSVSLKELTKKELKVEKIKQVLTLKNLFLN